MNKKVVWIKVGLASEIKPNFAKTILIGEQVIAIFNLNNKFFAISAKCQHQGGPLGQEQAQDGNIQCPWHRWVYDIRTGKTVKPTPFDHHADRNACQQTFKTKVEKGHIFVEI